MVTLYKPVLIESVEQAEALPDDAIVISDGGDRYRRSGKDWMGVAGELPSYLDVDLLCNERITALVPIEAEVEHEEEPPIHAYEAAEQEPTDTERAVRWLHREREWRPLDGTFIGGTVCNACRRPYPCPTISVLDEPARATRRDEEK